MSDNGRRLEVWKLTADELALLTIREAAVWALALEGMRLREIGERMNERMQAVRAVVRRAKKKVRPLCREEIDVKVSPGDRCPSCLLLLPCFGCPAKIGAAGFLTGVPGNLAAEMAAPVKDQRKYRDHVE